MSNSETGHSKRGRCSTCIGMDRQAFALSLSLRCEKLYFGVPITIHCQPNTRARWPRYSEAASRCYRIS